MKNVVIVIIILVILVGGIGGYKMYKKNMAMQQGQMYTTSSNTNPGTGVTTVTSQTNDSTSIDNDLDGTSLDQITADDTTTDSTLATQ